jgi:hypothetical protein
MNSSRTTLEGITMLIHRILIFHKILRPFVSIVLANFHLFRFLLGLWLKYAYTPINNALIFPTMGSSNRVGTTKLVLWTTQCMGMQKVRIYFLARLKLQTWCPRTWYYRLHQSTQPLQLGPSWIVPQDWLSILVTSSQLTNM